MPMRPWPLDKLKPDSAYRRGDRRRASTAAHSAVSRAWRRALSETEIGPAQRAAILAVIGETGSVAQAAEAVGVTQQQIYGLASWHAEWREKLDDATAGWCAVHNPRCGTPTGYRHHGGRCPQCRAAHRHGGD